MVTFRDNSPWQDPPRAPDREELLAPRTQIVADREAYLGQGRHDVGRRISDDQVELFASTDVASALQMEFAQHDPSFIAVHDVGTSASLRLLTSLSAAMGGRVHRLSVRRQGHGMAMAVLQFMEVPLADGTPVRVYATDVSVDGPLRAAIARVLLAHSRLGVLLMGSLSQSALASQLQPLEDALHKGPWPNREMLMVPLGAGVALAGHASQLGGRSGVAVHVTPQAAKTRQAWAYIAGAWNRLHGGLGDEHVMRTEFESGPADAAPASPPVPQSEAPTEPMDLHPAAGAAPPVPAASQRQPWQVYADSCCLLKGAVASCVFNIQTLQDVARAGHLTAGGQLAEQGGKLLRAMADATRTLGLGGSPSEGAVTAGGYHLIVRPVPGHPQVAVTLIVEASTNLTLAKMQLERITAPKA